MKKQKNVRGAALLFHHPIEDLAESWGCCDVREWIVRTLGTQHKKIVRKLHDVAEKNWITQHDLDGFGHIDAKRRAT